MRTTDYIDLFAGAGGWSMAARNLGLEGMGVEIDPSACATRKAAGFETYEGSVSDTMAMACTTAYGARGLIASPPCTTFSTAGKGSGRAEMDKVLEAIRHWSWACHTGTFADPRTGLILEPLRWIMNRAAAERPYQWIAMEQVPPCLPIWHAYAEVLEALGYATAVGLLQAEQYGTPQTRKRAILMAHRDHPVSLPTPTHSRYYNRDPKRLDDGVKPWVSIAEALGWTEDTEVVSNYLTGDTGVPGRRSGDEPAATVTSKINRNQVVLRSNYSAGSSHSGPAAERGRAIRELTDPAFTVAGKGGDQWVYRASTMSNAATRSSDQPAPTIAFARDTKSGMIGDGTTTRRVTVAEAGVLQGFPADHPWQGTKTAQYTQVGNAISVQLAQAVLAELTGHAWMDFPSTTEGSQ